MRERFDEKFQVSTGKNHNDTNKECFPCEGGYCQMSPENMKDFIEQELKRRDDEIVGMIERNKENNPLGERAINRNEALDDIINTIKTEHDKQ